MHGAEYLVVIEVLNRTHGRDRQRMYRTIRTFERREIDAAIADLEQAGVVVVKGRTVLASPALRCLERLNLIGV